MKTFTWRSYKFTVEKHGDEYLVYFYSTARPIDGENEENAFDNFTKQLEKKFNYKKHGWTRPVTYSNILAALGFIRVYTYVNPVAKYTIHGGWKKVKFWYIENGEPKYIIADPFKDVEKINRTIEKMEKVYGKFKEVIVEKSRTIYVLKSGDKMVMRHA